MNFDVMRRKLLEKAVQGQLVPQLDDEPAVEQVGTPPEEVPFAIPEKWKWCTLGSIAVYGGRNQTAAEEIPGGSWILDLEDIEKNTGRLLNKKRGISVSSSKTSFKKGDVLYGKLRPYLNKAIIADEDGFCTTEIVAIPEDSFLISLSPEYLKLCLMSPFFVEYATRCSYGVKMPRLGTKDAKAAAIPFPPIQEQHRIVAKLKNTLELINKAEKAHSELVGPLSDQFRSLCLERAIKGELVPQLGNEPQVKQLSETLEDVTFAIPEKWKWAKLSEVATKIQYGYTASASDSGSARLLRITDIQDGQVEWNSTPYCSPTASEIKKFELKAGDILIVRTGGTIGKSFLVQNTPSEPSVFASYLIRISPETQLILPNFLKFFLESPYYWTQLKDNSRGTGQPNVNAKALGNLRLPLPPLEEQRRIVEKLNALFKDLDRLTG